MIIDAIANLSHYTKLFPTIPEALETMNSIEHQELGKNIFQGWLLLLSRRSDQTY